VEHVRSGQSFYLGFLLGFDVFAEELEILGVDPGGHVAMGDDGGALFGENGVPCDVIEVIVGIHDELDGQFGEHADFAKQSAGGPGFSKLVPTTPASMAMAEPSVSSASPLALSIAA